MASLLKTGTSLFGGARLTREDDIFLHRLNVACLPEVHEAADSIIALIKELTTASISASERQARFYALARYVVLEIHTELERDSSQSLAVDVDANIAVTAIFRITNELISNINQVSSDVDKKQQATLVYTQLELLLATNVLHSEYRRRLPVHFWEHVHGLYQFAEHNRILKFRCRPQEKVTRDDSASVLTIAQLYTVIILTGATDLTSVTNELSRDVSADKPRIPATVLQNILYVSVESTAIKSYSPRRLKNPDHLQFTIDLKSDAPIFVRHKAMPDDARLRCLDLQALRRKFAKLVQDASHLQPDHLVNSDMTATAYWQSLTDAVIETWSSRQDRGLDRLAVEQALHLVISPKHTLSMLVGSIELADDDIQTLTTKISVTNPDADTRTRERSEIDNVASALQAVIDMESTPVAQASSVGRPHATVVEATALDSSADGIRARCLVSHVSHLDDGEFIAWRKCGQSTATGHAESWQAGVVRWVKNQDGQFIDIGISVIEGELCSATSAAVGQGVELVLIVKEHNDDAIKATIVCPSGTPMPALQSRFVVGPREFTLSQVIDTQSTALLRLSHCIFSPA